MPVGWDPDPSVDGGTGHGPRVGGRGQEEASWSAADLLKKGGWVPSPPVRVGNQDKRSLGSAHASLSKSHTDFT